MAKLQGEPPCSRIPRTAQGGPIECVRCGGHCSRWPSIYTFCRCTTCVRCCRSDASCLACRAFSAFRASHAFQMLHLSVAFGVAFPRCTRFAWSVRPQLSRTVYMAGLMAYTRTEDTGVYVPDTGAWTHVRTKDAKRQRLCISVLGVVVRVF